MMQHPFLIGSILQGDPESGQRRKNFRRRLFAGTHIEVSFQPLNMGHRITKYANYIGLHLDAVFKSVRFSDSAAAYTQ